LFYIMFVDSFIIFIGEKQFTFTYNKDLHRATTLISSNMYLVHDKTHFNNKI